MNREIKFRGKVEDDWLYGDFVRTVDPIIEYETYAYIVSHSCYHMIKIDTVCQFTGCQFGGKDIYEHDVFRINDTFLEVVYNEEIAAFAFLDIATQNVGSVPFVDVVRSHCLTDVELVGNIYDDIDKIHIAIICNEEEKE